MNFQELYRKIEAIDKGYSLSEGPSSQELENSAYTMTFDQFVDVYGEENAHIWHKVNGEEDGAESDDDAVDMVRYVIKDILQGARQGHDMTDNIADELGDYFDVVDNSGNKTLQRAYSMVRAAADTSPEEQAQAAQSALKMLSGKELSENIEECGDMGPMSPMSQPKQQDNVNMNVSLNASGQGGIRDLLDILQNIESGEDDVDMPVAIKSMGMALDDDYANEPDETYQSVSAVTATGSDLHSKGIEAPKVNGGGNPMTHMERLENLYQQIKLREGSGPKEKQKTSYVDRSSDESKAKVQAAKDAAASAEKAKPGKKLLSKINSK